MFEPTRLIFVPSKNRFVRFKELKNRHFLALIRSQDSLPDSTCIQWDILEDCLVDDDIKVSELTMFDSLMIFISWRINCVGAEKITGEGIDDYFDVSDWLVNLHHVLTQNFKEEIILPNSGLKLGVDIPTLQDDMEAQRYFMLGGNSDENKIKENSNRRSVCILKTVNDQQFESYHQKRLLVEALDPTDYNELVVYSRKVSDILSKIVLDLNIQQEINFSIDLISSLIRFLFSGNIDASLNESLYMSKKCNISYQDFLDMIPIESSTLILTMEKASSNNQKEGTEDITDEYFEQYQ